MQQVVEMRASGGYSMCSVVRESALLSCEAEDNSLSSQTVWFSSVHLAGGLVESSTCPFVSPSLSACQVLPVCDMTQKQN